MVFSEEFNEFNIKRAGAFDSIQLMTKILVKGMKMSRYFILFFLGGWGGGGGGVIEYI